jgi:hypothetical protein
MKSASRVLCVAGMHRSGTSLVARILSLLGVDFGPAEDLLPPQSDNPHGFWEHSSFTALNDEILEAMGGTWEAPPALPPHWYRQPRLEPLRTRARQLIQARSGRARFWAWKDPRNCLTLPFWRSLVPQMRFVVCLRNPIDVSCSLAQRNGFSPVKSEALWLRYTQEALTNTAGGERLLLFYEDLVSDAGSQLRRLASFARPQRPAANIARLRGLARSVEPALHHHRSSSERVFDRGRLSFASQSLYALLRAEATAAETHPRPEHLLDRFSELCRDEWGQAERHNELERRLKAAQAHCGELQVLRARQEAELELQGSILEARERTARELTQRLEKSDEALDTCRKELSEMAARMRAREDEVGRLRAALGAITGSRAYPVLTAIWAVANLLAPVGSRRERALRSLINGNRRPD